MGFYSETALALLCQQILRDNPGIPYPLTKDNVLILSGPLTTGLGTSGRNARVILNGKSGAGFSGRKEFFYDRLKMDSLYTTLLKTLVLTMPNSVATNADLLPTINDALGLNLTATDITTPNTALGLGRSPVSVTLTMSTTCLCFTGTLTLQWQRGVTEIYPDSGPGSKSMLMGNMTEGYFGMVTQQELIGGSDLFAAFASGKSLGSAVGIDSADLVWLKFALDGKFCYFPSKNIGANISWQTLMDNGAAKGDAKSPIAFKAGDGTNVFAQLRLPRLGANDTMDPVRGDPGADTTRLFNKTHKQTYGTGAWDELTNLDLGQVFTWYNRYISNTSSAYLSQMSQISTSSIGITAAGNWRPFIILVDGKQYLIPVSDVQIATVDTLKKLPAVIDRNADPKMLVSMKNVLGTQYRTISPIANTQASPAVVSAVQDVVVARTLKPLSASITITITQKTDLAQANGELSGFK